jgi:hypothetical protein
MIITSLPITFQAALEPESSRLTQRICVGAEEVARLVEVGATGHDRVAARLVAR